MSAQLRQFLHLSKGKLISRFAVKNVINFALNVLLAECYSELSHYGSKIRVAC
jgi:hypothetical protein